MGGHISNLVARDAAVGVHPVWGLCYQLAFAESEAKILHNAVIHLIKKNFLLAFGVTLSGAA